MNEMTTTAFTRHLNHAVKFHGHLCGGQVLGVRMAMAGLRELGIEDSRGSEGRDLVIFIEIDRCAADAIISVTGRTPGKRSIKIMDYGKMVRNMREIYCEGKTLCSPCAENKAYYEEIKEKL